MWQGNITDYPTFKQKISWGPATHLTLSAFCADSAAWCSHVHQHLSADNGAGREEYYTTLVKDCIGFSLYSNDHLLDYLLDRCFSWDWNVLTLYRDLNLDSNCHNPDNIHLKGALKSQRWCRGISFPCNTWNETLNYFVIGDFDIEINEPGF